MSPSRLVTMTSWEPRFRSPKLTMPSISLTSAGSSGVRASKSSSTRGRPPVMSLVWAAWRGIFASVWPACTSSPSSTWMRASTGML